MNSISDLVLSYFDMVDEQWMQRQRLLNTRKIFGYITEAAISKKGIDHIILQDNAALSPAALCRARQKLPIDAFYYINETIIHNNAQLSRVFAVDGSKVHVPASFKSYGYKSRTNDKPVSRKAKHPLAMISSLVDVHTNLCCDYILSKHFNERTSAIEHLKQLQSGDIVIFDRGYFSSDLYNRYSEQCVDTVFRLKCDHFKAVASFVKSAKSDKVLTTVVNKQTLRIRLLKYYIQDKLYVIGTSLFSTSKKAIAQLYRQRWNVELSFRRLKSNLNLNYSFCLKESTWKQTVQARVLADTISMLLKKHSPVPTRPVLHLRRFVKTCRSGLRYKSDMIHDCMRGHYNFERDQSKQLFMMMYICFSSIGSET